MRAVVSQSDLSVAVEDIPIPPVTSTQVLIKVHAIGTNPIDWKAITSAGQQLGTDVVGLVSAVGSSVPPSVQVGQRRTGMYPAFGYAEYAAYEWDTTWLVPDEITDEQAITIGMSYFTAAQALFDVLEIPLPPLDRDVAPNVRNEWLFIHAGSTGMGFYAIQLAKIAGFKVVTTAAARNLATLRSIGADATVDRYAPDYVEQVKEVTGGSLRLGYDCWTVDGAVQKTTMAFAPEGGKIVAVFRHDRTYPREDVEVRVCQVKTMVGMPRLEGFDLDVTPERRQSFGRFAELLTALVRRGKLKYLKTVDVGGLEDVNAALERMKKKDVSGEKWIIHV